MSASRLPENLAELTRAVRDFGARRRRWARLGGAGQALLWGPGLLLPWIGADALIGLGPWLLLLTFTAIVAVGLRSLWRHLLPPCRRAIDAEEEALVIENLHGALDNDLIGALQLGREAAGTDTRLGGAGPLVEALLERTVARLRTLDLRGLLDLRACRRLATAGALVLALWTGLCVDAWPVVAGRAQNLQQAWLVFLDTLFPVTMEVTPGDRAIVRGSDLALTVTLEGARRSRARLTLIDEEEGTTQALALDLRESGTPGVTEAAYALANVQKPFAYFFAYGNTVSPTYRIAVGDRPAIQAISYELVYPAYTGQPPRTLTGQVPKLQALAGTSVMVSFAATTELHPDLCRVVWQDGAAQELTVQGRFGHFSFQITRPDQAAIHLCGHHGKGFEMESPVPLAIGLERDHAPSVAIRIKKRELTLLAEQAAAFALPFVAEDDFGLTEIKLTYRISTIDEMLGRSPREGEVARRIEPARDRVKGTFEEVFKSLDPALAPGDKVVLELAARDNNTETGPGLGRSHKLTFVVVRPDLGAFTERDYNFATRASVLGGLQKVKRVTDLLVEGRRTVRTEDAQEVEKKEIKARVRTESWPGGAEDRVGAYFELLSGSR